MAFTRSFKTDILLIEDNPDDAELIRYALERYNLSKHILHFEDGESALTYLQNETNPLPRVIFLDVKLPKKGGVEILAALRAYPRTRKVPVVMLTSSASERDIQASYQHGANSYVVKPIDFEEFQAAIRNLGFYWLLLNEDVSEKS